MNANSAALISILSKCNPQDEELAYESQIQDIVHSKDYIELSCRKAFAKQFSELLSENKLRSYSSMQRENIIAALPSLTICLNDIESSLRNGAGPELRVDDYPNFLDKNTMEALSRKLQAVSGKNYSNIEEGNFMVVFDDTTIKSAQEFFMNLPENTIDYNAAISGIVGQKKFCISEEEINQLDSKYHQQIQALLDKVNVVKRHKSRWRLIKFMLGITLLFLPSFIGGLTGLMSSNMVVLCTFIQLIFVVIFWIRG